MSETSADPRTPAAPRAPREAVLRVRDEIAKAVVGQDGAVSGLVAALLVRGHVLLEGVPGVAKTLLVKTLARTLDLEFKRVQFTPDLMPSDVTGQVIFEQRDGSFRFRRGRRASRGVVRVLRRCMRRRILERCSNGHG